MSDKIKLKVYSTSIMDPSCSYKGAKMKKSKNKLKLDELLSISEDHYVTDICEELIPSFRRDNLDQFIGQVATALKKFEGQPENEKKVLNFAKIKVHHFEISEKFYGSLEEFASDLKKYCDDSEVLSQIKRKIASLSPYPDEKMFHYGLRAMALKEEYTNNYCLYFETMSVPEKRLEEVEEFVIKKFTLGLNPFIRMFVEKKETKKLDEAIESAIKAEELSRELRQPNYRRRYMDLDQF